MTVEHTTRFVECGADAYQASPTVCLEKPRDRIPLDVLHAECGRKHNGYVTVRYSTPHRPRSTGARSQNSRLFGHSEDIAGQVVKDGKPTFTKRQIHDAMLRMAVSEGYPTYLDINGVESPLPDEQASMEQLNLVLRVQQRYADIHGLWLHEYIAEGPHKNRVYKSIGGRSYEEMMRHAPELNAELGIVLTEEKT